MKAKIKMLKHKLEIYGKEILRGTIIGLGLSFGITVGVISMYAVNWSGVSTATSGDTLTANMWNATIGTLTGAVETLDNVVVKITGNQTIGGIKNFSGTLIAGKIGIGTSDPQSALDINGGIKIGDDTSTCTGTNAGTSRYNSTSKTLELCDGSAWSSKISSEGTLPDCDVGEGLIKINSSNWGCANVIVTNLVGYSTGAYSLTGSNGTTLNCTNFLTDIKNLFDKNPLTTLTCYDTHNGNIPVSFVIDLGEIVPKGTINLDYKWQSPNKGYTGYNASSNISIQTSVGSSTTAYNSIVSKVHNNNHDISTGTSSIDNNSINGNFTNARYIKINNVGGRYTYESSVFYEYSYGIFKDIYIYTTNE